LVQADIQPRPSPKEQIMTSNQQHESHSIQVRTGVDAGGQTLDPSARRAVRVRSGVRAGHRRIFK
jgi:hypothetical protein